MFKNVSLRLLFCVVISIIFPHLATAERNTASADGDAFIGIWEYQEKNSGDPTHYYLKILKVSPGRFRLIEGFKGGYVNDKDRIMWRDRKKDNYADDVIYLKLSRGKLKGELVSDVFRATHAIPFKYKLILDLKSNNKLHYSIWSSIRGETETFEATRVGDSVPSVRDVPKGQAASQTSDAEGTMSRLGFDGFGPIQIGMTVPQAERAFGRPLVKGETINDCVFYQPKGGPSGLSLTVIGGRIRIVEVRDNSKISTEHGLFIGSSITEIRRAYKKYTIEEKENPYGSDELIITVKKFRHSSGKQEIVFSVVSGRIVSIEAGDFTGMGWLTRCT